MQWHHLSMWFRQSSQTNDVKACKDMFGEKKKERKTWHCRIWYWGFNRKLVSLRQDWTTVQGVWAQHAIGHVVFQKKLCKIGSSDYLFHLIPSVILDLSPLSPETSPWGSVCLISSSKIGKENFPGGKIDVVSSSYFLLSFLPSPRLRLNKNKDVI